MIVREKVTCPICRSTSIHTLFEGREWSPVFYDKPSEVKDTSKRQIKLWYCECCGFIQQYPQTRKSLDYTKISRGTSKQLQDYTTEIVESLGLYGIKSSSKLLDIGSNDGSFLNKMKIAGYDNLMGVEPSRFLSEKTSKDGFKIINDFFDSKKSQWIIDNYGQMDAVICRHTLEHVIDIRDFIGGILNVLVEGGVAYVEVPDTDWTINNLLAYEFWDEHISYFNKNTLENIFIDVGFSIKQSKIFKFRDVQNIGCWIVKDSTDKKSNKKKSTFEKAKNLSQFQSLWDLYSSELRTNLLSKARPYIALGASHVQQNFLNYTLLSDCVDMLIDDDPEKMHRFLYFGKAVPIITTDKLIKTINSGTIILSAFPYPEWQDRIKRDLCCNSFSFLETGPK